MIEETLLQISKKLATAIDPAVVPSNGSVPKRAQYQIDLPGEIFDREQNLVIQVFHVKLPMTYEFCQQIQSFQRKVGLDTQELANLVIALGTIQLQKLMTDPLATDANFDANR